VGYPVPLIYEEAAFIAYHFHWSLAEIFDLEHADRRHWVREISSINEAINAQDD
jgi:Family of unknown function (DUF6760)